MKRRRITGGVLILGVLGALPGFPVIADPPAPVVAKKAYDPAGATDAALDAFRRGDAKALESISLGEVDPWIVATMLLERGEAKAAAALAASAPRPDTQALPAYVVGHVVGSKDAALRPLLLASAEALTAGRSGEAIVLCDEALRDAKGLLRVQLLHARGHARSREKELSGAAEDYALAADGAEALGWLQRATMTRDLAGLRWLELAEDAKALGEFEKGVALDERRDDKKRLVTSLSHLATACGRLGDVARAMVLQERAIPLAESLGDRKTLIVLLNNQGISLRILGRFREGLAFHERAGGVAREAGDREGAARSEQHRGLTLRDLGDARGAMAALRAALDAWLTLGNRAGAVDARAHLSGLERLLGDWAEGKASAAQALRDAEALGDEALLAHARGSMAGALLAEGASSEARTLLEPARAYLERRGSASDRVRTLKMLAVVHTNLRDLPQALSIGTEAVSLARAKGTAADLAIALDGLSQVRSAMGEPDRAIEHAEECRALYVSIGNIHGAAGAWDRVGRAKVELGDAEGGLALIERARAEFEKQGDVFRHAMAESDIGDVYEARGAWLPATAHHERALAMLEALGDEVRVGTELLILGRIWQGRGDMGRALAYLETAERRLEGLPDGYGLAAARHGLAKLWVILGELARARSLMALALAGFEKAGAPADAALEAADIATIQARLGNVPAALLEAARAAALLEGVGDAEERSLGWGRLARVHAMAGALPKALELAQRSLALLEGENDPLTLGHARHRLATFLLQSGRGAEALEMATIARNLFERAGRSDLQGGAEALRASTMGRLGQPKDALEASRASIELLEGSLRGLGDEELSQGWSRQSRLPFSVGIEACVSLGAPADAVWFVERSRGRSLLEMFAVRDTLRDAVLPPALREAELDARARRFAAGEAMRRATERAEAVGYERARETYDRAGEDLARVEARAQREAKRAAALSQPAPATVAAIRERLRKDEALVLYGSTGTRIVAVLVEPAGARLIALGTQEEVSAAVDALRAGDPGADCRTAAGTLRSLILSPLGLGSSVRRLIVSPDTALAFVPFALLDREREVVLVPSATVLDALRGETTKQGRGVLALGDPAYRPTAEGGAVALLRTGSLSLPLPHSREEVAEVGTTPLLGAEATKVALRGQLAKQRWRSVHFACHGLLDAERPALSGLALTPVGDDDGVLRVLDVFRLKVDADLVVLSACETARGKVFSGEGILGLTRAFLYAGSPRVIASLWKVDDAATRALMKRFYARWAEGATPAAALREAQAFVASQSAWKHPHFWAAWTLWGLPD